MKTFKFYSDASHGWLAVPRQLLVELNLLSAITAWSYQSKSGATVYLEEDCDASRFVSTLKTLNIDHAIVDVDHGDRSHIRNYTQFKVG